MMATKIADPADVRAWAKREGVKVADRGRLPNSLIQLYLGKHPGTVMRAKVGAVLAAVALSVAGGVTTAQTADAKVAARTVVREPCVYEDGHTQASCYWDAKYRGDGKGSSFVSLDRGRATVYVPRMPRDVSRTSPLVVTIKRNLATVVHGRKVLVRNVAVIR